MLGNIKMNRYFPKNEQRFCMMGNIKMNRYFPKNEKRFCMMGIWEISNQINISQKVVQQTVSQTGFTEMVGYFPMGYELAKHKDDGNTISTWSKSTKRKFKKF